MTEESSRPALNGNPPDGPALFRATGQQEGDALLLPQPMSSSGWGADHIRGLAVSGALARATERTISEAGRTDLHPTRWSVDLFRVARARPSVARARIVRQGRRLCLVDSTFEQDGRPVARATALYLPPGQSPEGQVWSAPTRPQPPPAHLSPSSDTRRLYFSEGAGWTTSSTPHQSDARKQTWHEALTVVHGERPSPFQMVATVADVASLVTNWGSNGLAFMNVDITLAMVRLPEALEVGLSTTDHHQERGISVGTAVVFDRAGTLGAAMVSAVALGHRVIDASRRDSR